MLSDTSFICLLAFCILANGNADNTRSNTYGSDNRGETRRAIYGSDNRADPRRDIYGVDNRAEIPDLYGLEDRADTPDDVYDVDTDVRIGSYDDGTRIVRGDQYSVIDIEDGGIGDGADGLDDDAMRGGKLRVGEIEECTCTRRYEKPRMDTYGARERSTRKRKRVSRRKSKRTSKRKSKRVSRRKNKRALPAKSERICQLCDSQVLHQYFRAFITKKKPRVNFLVIRSFGFVRAGQIEIGLV